MFVITYCHLLVDFHLSAFAINWLLLPATHGPILEADQDADHQGKRSASAAGDDEARKVKPRKMVPHVNRHPQVRQGETLLLYVSCRCVLLISLSTAITTFVCT